MKIALILNDDFSMYHFRGGLIKTLAQKGLDVTVITPPGEFICKLEGLKVKCIPVPMKRFVSPLSDMIFFSRLYRIFKTEKLDIVHNMTVKPNIYGTIAAKLARVMPESVTWKNSINVKRVMLKLSPMMRMSRSMPSTYRSQEDLISVCHRWLSAIN